MQNFSGVTVLEERSMRTVLICLLYRLSSELTKDAIYTMSLENESPWLSFDKKYEYLLTVEAKNDIKKIKTLLTLGESMKIETDENYINYKNKHMTVKEEFDKLDLGKYSHEEKLKLNLLIDKNKEVLEHAYNVISYINNILKKIDEDVLSVQTNFKDKSLLEVMVKISLDYGSMKHYNPRSIVLKYSKEKKFVKK